MLFKPMQNYDFKYIEKVISDFWKNTKLETKKPRKKFSILMPPPNITGKLHLGHALNNFLQDALIRFYKLKGYQTLWIPGLDHAGIAAEIIVKKWITANKWKINDDKELIFYFYKWFEMKKTEIKQQWNKLGLMIDEKWFAFTLNENFQKAVKKAFVELYQKKLIYRDQRLINFDLYLQTALADIEVVHKKIIGEMYYIKYWTTDKKHFVVVATTRPETIFADQALVINPNDIKNQKWSKYEFLNPLTNKKLIMLKNIKVNVNFGTGILKCTPGHDFLDFSIGQENNLLPVICFDKKGILNNLANEFAGLDRLSSRPKIVKKLKEMNNLIKIEKIEHNLPFSSRTNTLIEPVLSKQWFLKTKKWSKIMIQKKNEINFYPQKYHKNFLNWMEKCEDWCISRQLKWGHRLPVYYNSKNEIKVSLSKPLNNEWKQSNDVLDTWFSSGLWSLINFGWNNAKNQILNSFLPINVLVTSYDIIFFWVSRMLFLHNYFAKQIPFQKIFIHGLIRTKNNEKMSKSKGNVIDPNNLIEKFGVDSLRFYLLGKHKIGDDLKFQEEKLIQANQFCNKIWNINRFVERNKINVNNFQLSECENELNYDICKKFLLLQKKITKNWKKNLWSVLLDDLTNFIWKEFSNQYLRLAKIQLKNLTIKKETQQTINFIWQQILFILHPFLPFLTEFLWQKYHQGSSILNNVKFKKQSKFVFLRKLLVLESFYEIVEELKKTNFDLQKNKIWNFSLESKKYKFYSKHLKQINQWLQIYKCQIIKVSKSEIEKIIFIDKLKQIDLEKEILFVKNELIRSNKILSNQLFLKKAKIEIIKLEKIKKTKWKNKLQNLLNLKKK